MSVGERIKDIRDALRQDAFADKIGVHINTVGRWERGQRTPDVDDLNKILAAYPKISPAWLLTGEGEKEKKVVEGKLLTEAGYDELLVHVIQAAIESAGKVPPETARIYAHCAFDIAALISESRDDLPDVQEIKGMFSMLMLVENNLKNGELKLDGRKIKFTQSDYGKLMDMIIGKHKKG